MHAPRSQFPLALTLAISLCAGSSMSVASDSQEADPPSSPAARSASEPLRLDRLLGTPEWLHLFFTQRTRYESLRNQFRPVDSEDNRALSLRTTLFAELRFEPISLGLELADSRLYLDGDDAPLNSTLINPLDLLQAHVSVNVRDVFADGARLGIRLGRQTIDLGGRRLVARNRFRNTINSFTGLELSWVGPQEAKGRLFATFPVRRRPTRVEGLDANEVEFDSELTSTRFWGLFYGSRPRADGMQVEAYLLGLDEDDGDLPTTNRDFLTPGLRLSRPAEPGRWDFELEAVYQHGRSRASALPADTTDLRHRAFFAHAAVGHTFATGWRPRVALLYDYASGDRAPDDGVQGRFDTLYGARRFELGPTGIYGALARSNLHSPALQATLQPHADLFVYLVYRPAWLARARDFWVTTGIRDPRGASGSFLGHQFEGAVRWWVVPGNLLLEAGLTYLRLGEFPKRAPNGDPEAGDPGYAYLQLGFQF
jgi:hypothetical protein